MKVFKNPAWLGVLVGVLAIAVTLGLYLKARPVRKLRVEILSNSPLVSMNTAKAKEMQVLYKGVPVKTLSLILLKFANEGTEPIKESDYSEPIRVLISQSGAVGEVSVQETRPEGIQLTPTLTASNQVELAKVLLNPGDQAVLRILALNNDSTLKISARIVGIRTLDIQSVLGRNETPSGQPDYLLWGGTIALAVLLIVGSLVWQSRPVIQWRKNRFGLDPPRHFYTLAQGGMLTLPASKGTEKASSALAQVIKNLDRCFTWDVGYMEKVNNDPLFSSLLGYEPFKDMADKHKRRGP